MSGTRDGTREATIRPGVVLKGLAHRVGPEAMLRHVEVHPEVGSTNASALEDGREGLLVVALEQTRGRGRHGSDWSSPRGGLYMSYVPPARHVPSRPTDISLLAALAAANAIEAALADLGVPGPRADLKWPNDVLVDGGKVAGVLVQSTSDPVGEARTPHRVAVGIGVNVNAAVSLVSPGDRSPDEWPLEPRSLRETAGAALDLEVLLVDLMDRLLDRLEAGLDGEALEEYRSRCVTLGERVAFSEGGRRLSGTAVDISREGALVVEMEGGGRHLVVAGEVRHLRGARG